MLIRFYEITTNTVGGVYRKEDFIDSTTGLFWKITDINRPSTLVLQGDYNFDATDNISELVIEVNTPLLYYPNRITHIVAETNQVTGSANSIRYVAYSVDSVEYMGFSQVKFLLVEDPVISHMTQLFDSNMLITRTNDFSKFMSHDISDLAYSRERTTVDFGVYDYTGKWVVYTAVVNASDYGYMRIIYRDLETSNYEYISSLANTILKYPEVSTTLPTTIPYYGKIVNVGVSGLYQAQYDYSIKKIIWIQIPTSLTDYPNGVEKTCVKTGDRSGWIGPSVRLITGDMLTVNFAFPVADNVYGYGIVSYDTLGTPTYGYRRLPSADRVESIGIRVGSTGDYININTMLSSKRIITGIAFNEQGTYRPAGAVNTNLYTSSESIRVVTQTMGGASGPVPTGFPVLFNISSINTLYFTLSSVLEQSPFRNYYLSVFGQNIPIKTKLSSKNIIIKSSVSSTDWNVVIYADNPNNIIWSGRISASMPYALDKYQEFLSQNSTYTASKWVNTILGGGSRIGKSAITGILSGSAGASALSIGTGIASLGQDIANMSLSERAMKDAPDTIKGDSNDFGSIEISPYGIYFYYMSPTTDALNTMKTELYANGFPTSYIGKIDSMSWSANDIYGQCKLVKGRLVGMMHNYHITSLLNDRLNQGIVILTP